VRELRKVVFILCLFALFGAKAQERYNYLAVNQELLEDAAGPYYFIKQGNNRDSYARADLLAQSLGLSFSLDENTMRFEKEGLAITLNSTTDIEAGLSKHSDALVANNQVIESPMGILVEGNPYAPITAISAAVGGSSGWQSDANLVWIHFEPQAVPRQSEPAPEAVQATPVNPQSNPQSNIVAAPRYGLQKDGQTRLVLDLPPGSFYEIFAYEQNLIVTLPNLSAGAFSQMLDPAKDVNLESYSYKLVNQALALVVTTRYPLDPSGMGYQFSLLEANAEIPHERLVIEFSPSFSSNQVVQSAQGFTVEDLPITPTIIASQTPTGHQKVVVIDAGHGGKDPGALSSNAMEKDVVFSISLKLKALLEAQGIQVILTRDEDYFLELEQRADFATPDINLFVAIHANSVKAEQAHGVETWVFGEPLEPALLALAMEENGGNTAVGQARTEEALQVATGIVGDIILESQLNYSLNLANLVQDEMVRATGAKNRGVKQNAFYVLRKARSPSILVETGFVSNPTEGSLLATDDYQNRLAQAIANGIVVFFNNGGIIASTTP
jgi:N-acetylmuramoyl-L-alanine amidase